MAPLGSGCTPAGVRAARKPTPRSGGAGNRLALMPGEAKLWGIGLAAVMLNLSDLLKADNQVIFFLKQGSLLCPEGKRICFGLSSARRES